MILFWLSCLAFFLAGCTNEGKYDKVENLRHKVLDIPEMLIGSPVDIQKDGDHLIVLDYKQDSLFHKIDWKNGRYLGMFGQKGQGPNEFIYPSSLNGLGDGRFSCYDVAKKELSLIGLDEKWNKVDISRLFRYEPMITFNIVPVVDSLFIVSGETNGSMFALIDKGGEVLSLSDEYPYKDEDEKKISTKYRAMAYQGTLRVNSKGYFAYAVTLAEQIHLYKVENRMIEKLGAVIDGYGHYEPYLSRNGGYGVAHSAEYPICYMDLAVSDEYVYALYAGRTFESHKLLAYEGEVVFVYDWTGKLVKTYQLDVPITQFCVDEDEGVIYATASIPEPTIVSFNLD